MSERIKFMTAKMNKKPLKIHDITGVVKQLIALGLVNEKQKSYLRRDKETTGQQYTNLNDNQISLRITVDDITNSLRNDALFGQLLD